MDDAGIALLNQKIGDALLESGRANVGVTEHNGVTCLKLTLLNPTVTLEDIKVLLSLVERTAQEVLRSNIQPLFRRKRGSLYSPAHHSLSFIPSNLSTP
jgi:glutamate/tyrosine decarboxylase-like PLP-dependent enzyme